MQRDTASGGGIDVVVIKKDGIEKVFTKQLDTKLTM
jgi:20S proteasome alpha/beta subunit